MPNIRFITPVAVGILVALTGSVSAQFPNNTWLGTNSTNWTDAGNWSAGNHTPQLTETAYFNGTGNGNTSITFGGTTQTPGALQFDAGAVSYTIGTTAGDALSFAVDNNPAGTGVISMTAGATTPQQVNASLVFGSAAPLITNASTTAGANLTLGASAGSATITLANSSNLTFTPSSGRTITVNDSITASASLTVAGGGTTNFNGSMALTGGTITVSGTGTQSTSFNGVVSGTTNAFISSLGTVSFTNQNTYSGTTTFQSTGQPVIRIATDSTLSAGTLVSGPFGTGQLIFSSTTPAILTPVAADRTVANPVKFTNGFFAGNAAGDAHNLYLTGALTMDAAGRTSTINMFPGFAVYLGSSPNQATYSLLNLRMSFQTQATSQGGGLVVINDTVTSTGTSGGLTATNGAQIVLNGTNTYTGTTLTGGTAAAGFGRIYINGSTSTGAVTTVGVGTGFGQGGTIGGTGSAGGVVTVSSTTAGTQGGFLAPGAGTGPSTNGNGIGTLTAASTAASGLILNPFATYTFDHQPDASQFHGGGGSASPGVDNDTAVVTTALDLHNLVPSTSQAQFNLFPSFTTTNFALPATAKDYTAASFASISLPAGTFNPVTLANGTSATDITSLFSFAGTYNTSVNPIVAYTGTGSGPGTVVVEFVPVPEPTFILAVCGGLAGGLIAWRRKRVALSAA
jgi:hypothetical protein